MSRSIWERSRRPASPNSTRSGRPKPAWSPLKTPIDQVDDTHFPSPAGEPVEARIAFGLLPVAQAWVGTFLERRLEEVPIDGGAVWVRLVPGAYVALAPDLDRAG